MFAGILASVNTSDKEMLILFKDVYKDRLRELELVHNKVYSRICLYRNKLLCKFQKPGVACLLHGDLKNNKKWNSGK
jgi:hypothetical protein